MSGTTSKPIKKVDDESKQFIIDCLDGNVTHGFDVDSVYYFNGCWCLFEYLKCENESMTPYTSDPKYYPWNWKKFYSLYALAKGVNGKLILVNYSTRDSDKNLVKVMEVLSFDVKRISEYEKNKEKGPCEYMTFKTTKMTRSSFGKWLKGINERSSLPHIPI